jgi:hypothetical protein
LDIDASAQLYSRLRVFASVGRKEPNNIPNPGFKDYVTSPRHGLEYLFTKPDAQNRLTLRAGRFMPAYGIGFPEHPFVSRSMLNFNPSQERYAAELAWNNDHSSVIATGIGAEMEGNDTKKEKGGVIQVATAIGESSKIGINYYNTQIERENVKILRQMYGLFSHVSFNKDWYGLFQVDQPQGPDKKWGLIELFKLGWEVHQGWHLFAVQEYGNTNIKKAEPKFESYGVGTQWFPRPHWDFYLLFREERSTAGNNNDFQHVVWMIGHFYL